LRVPRHSEHGERPGLSRSCFLLLVILTPAARRRALGGAGDTRRNQPETKTFLNLLLMILKTLSAKFMIGTARQARVDVCKLPQNRMAEKLQEIAGVGIAVGITNPRARFVKTLSRIGALGRKPRRKDRAAARCVRLLQNGVRKTDGTPM
jgi:hypothetical protein